MARIPGMPRALDLTRRAPGKNERSEVPLAGTRAQSIQRLQIGMGGVILMVLLVGLASLIQDRTREVDAASVPGAAPTTEPSTAPTQQDPLVEAGVVPDLPEGPATQPSQTRDTVTDEGAQDVPPLQP